MLNAAYKEFGAKVAFLTVYAKEPHPSTKCPQPATFEAKLRDARLFKRLNHIAWTVAVDDLADTFHTGLSVYPAPAVIADANGHIVTHIAWARDRKFLENALRRTITARASASELARRIPQPGS